MKGIARCGVAVAALSAGAPVLGQESQYITLPAEPETMIWTQQPIIVSASRTEDLPAQDYPGSVTVVTRDQIDQRQARDIADILRDVPGVAVAGVPGQTQIRLRGSEANHVLVLVDGIEVSDPFAGEFDIGTLQAEIGSSLEVLRGPQSALYGSDAIGGVVAYRSASGDQVPGFAARIEGGTNGTVNGVARYGAFGDSWNAAVSAAVVSTDGEPNARGGKRDIGRDSYTVSGKGAVEVAPGFELRAVGRYILTQGDFNDQDFDPASATLGFVVDSPQTRFENEATYALLGARVTLLDGAWTHDLSGQIADIARDTFGPFGQSNSSEGERLKASYVTSYDFASGDARHSATFAADWERERFRNTTPGGFAFNGLREIGNTGLVAEYRLDLYGADLSAAIRRDFNDRFADETTFRIGAGYRVSDNTRLRASIGSGIKNPGFFELFGFVDGRFIGNEDLQPEKSTSWDVGVDQGIAGGKARVSLTYFDAELENEILTTFPPPDFVATPANRDTVSTQSGVELAITADIGGGLTFDGAYTYLDAEEDGVEEVRRPDHIASASLNWQAPRDAASANLTVRYNGLAEDLAFTDPSFVPVRVTLDEFVLVTLNGRAKLSDGIHVFARVENVLDDRYEQVFSFVSPGRSALVGIEARF